MRGAEKKGAGLNPTPEAFNRAVHPLRLSARLRAATILAMICAGIDAGSRSTKVVLFDSERRQIVGMEIADQAVEQERMAHSLFERACQRAGVEGAAVRRIIATGYGRNVLGFATSAVTEITCHAIGVRHLAPQSQTIIEIGGQDSKAIVLERDGRVRDFAMNDRCAAGSGRFLEMLATRLGVGVAALGELSRESGKPAIISSVCVVFAETEIIGLLAEGIAPADIAAGVQNAIAQRVAALAARMIADPVCFTGGVALQAGMVRALETALGRRVQIPSLPQYTGALGAAILAARTA
jgi:(R)-2-hydroxyacyl-CoA dehydratese activating ATPase